MYTQKSNSTGARNAQPSPMTRATDKPRVRMFSALEVYAPTHESYRGPWEAPVTTERGFAHRYEVGAEVGDGLLFVPESESHALDTQSSSRPVAGAGDPASFLVPAMMPTQSDAPPPAAPLVFSAVLASTSMRDDTQLASDAAACVRETHTAALAEATIPGAEARGVMQRRAPDAQGMSARDFTASTGRAADLAPELPSVVETGRSSGATLLDPTELFANTRRTPTQWTPVDDVPNASPAPIPLLSAQPVASLPDDPTRDPVSEARRLIDAGEHPEALKHLTVAMQSTRPPDDVWRLAALCWWHIARADGDVKAYANAADAMDRLLERDPSQADLWYRTGSCRLLQAASERGAAQRATLDLAVAALRNAAAENGHGDPLRAVALGDALFERAVAATDESPAARASRIAEAVDVLRDATRSARAPSSMAAWKLQQALQAQASLLSGSEASRLRLEAETVLAAGVESAITPERVVWVAARVENELAHAELAEGATRALHLRTFRESHRDLLTGPDAAPELLLSWLELLALETGHLRGDAARSRFDEGEAILKRLDDMLPGNAHVALARARLLHRRAAQSHGVSRHAVLSDAIAGLMPIVERGGAPQLQIEVAELLLERAAGASSMQAGDDCARAEAMASGLLEHPAFAMMAARCVLQARLGESSGVVDASVCRRLEALAGDDVRSRWLLARAAVRNGASREACGHCEAAARSGARLDQAFVQFWDQASRQWSATLHNPNDPAWLANRQRLRSAS